MRFHYLVVMFVSVFPGQWLNAAEFDASVGWADVRQLGLPVPGVVKKISAMPGSVVKPGEKMLSLDCGSYKAQYKENLALAKGLRPSVETSLKEKKLADDLFDRTVLSEVEHRKAELLYIEVKARHDSAVARAENSRWRTRYCQLVADRHLVVLDIQTSEGAMYNLMSENTILMTVASAEALKVSAIVTTPLKESYKPGQQATVKVDGKQYKTQLSAVKFLSGNQVEISAEFDNFDQRLISSKAAKLIIK